MKRKRGYATRTPPSKRYKRSDGRISKPRRRRPYISGIPEEVKFFDTANAFNFDTTGEVPATGQLTLIPQGDTQSTRDGRAAIIKSININGILSYTPAAAATSSDVVVMYLILDTQTNGAAAAVADVFTSTPTNFNVHMLNLNNSQRFRILKKWKFEFNPPAGVSGAYNSMSKRINYFKKCNFKIDWDGATGAITEIKSNNIFLMAGAGFTDDIASFNGTTRLRFIG